MCSLLVILMFAAAASAEEPSARSLELQEFRPQPALRVRATDVPRARHAVIDVHTHFRVKLRSSEQLDQFVRVMDRNHIAMCISLDGRIGDEIDEHLKFLDKYPGRFAVMANLNWRGDGTPDDPATWDCHRDDFPRRMAAALHDSRKRGAVGLKVFKDLGLVIRNPDGSLARVDDPRWDPIWRACGEAGLPVLIHTGDPVAFFQPVNERNERWEELHRNPDWSFHRPGYPTHAEIVGQLINVVERHRDTQFIAAHVANNPEHLEQVSEWLDRYPNLHVEIASRINELGRQPFTARRFLLKYQDRVLFGTDGPWPEERLRLYWRFLETDDEYFPYSEKPFPPQGLWNIYGVHLPDEVLEKLYHGNALRLFPSLQEAFAKRK
jgi:hypothetical protein